MAWLNGSTADWAAGWSFGGRRFTSCLVILAPGLALVVHTLARRPLVPIGLVALAAIVWNQLLITQYARGMLQPGEPVSFGRLVRQQAALVTRPPFFYPFAFPANAWFAWRTGLPIDRYDLLAPESLQPDIDLAIDASASRFLLEGWGPRASDRWGELRWIEGSRAELVLPLDMPGGVPVTVEVHARARLLDDAAPAAVSLAVNGHRIGTFTPESTSRSSTVFVVPAEPAIWTSGFNRIVLEKNSEVPAVAIYRIAVRGR